MDEYVHRMYATMDEYPEGIVTYPGPGRYPPCSLGLHANLDDARSLLASRDKTATRHDPAGKGRLLAYPLPDPLARALAASRWLPPAGMA